MWSTDFRRFGDCRGCGARAASAIVAILVWGVTVIGFGRMSGASHGRAGLLLWAALGFLAAIGTSAAVVWGGVLVVVGVLIAALAAPAFDRYRAP